ncbi:hypothetical protein CR513_51824 [Mucuna pruriens]|uniref:Uncharacterized protein n=1 Tax=Mucuna pruriens TaxID=157652 RepID=A0A371ET19_MUCPR|nr:hypothetical protein CR513_51824 [Mucuna pruriens]
MDTCPMIKATT